MELCCQKKSKHAATHSVFYADEISVQNAVIYQQTMIYMRKNENLKSLNIHEHFRICLCCIQGDYFFSSPKRDVNIT